MKRNVLVAAVALTTAVVMRPVVGQSPGSAVIDTIIVTTTNVYDPEEAAGNLLFRVANGVRVVTRAGVISRELLFEQGSVFDSALAAETARNLRALGVFRYVTIDTVRLVDGRLAALVNTADGWSTQLTLNARFGGDAFAWALGATETNFLGTANLVSVIFEKQPDRNLVTLWSRVNRLFGSHARAEGFYQALSDGDRAILNIGYPFRSFSDAASVEFLGEAANQRVLQYQAFDATRDTTRFRRKATWGRVTAAIAPARSTLGYLRVGASFQVRREEFFPDALRGTAIPDTVTGAFGVFGEVRRAKFKVVDHYNGFSHQEDLDLSSVVRISTWVAPSALGYEQDGIAPGIQFATGVGFPKGFVRLVGTARGLFTAGGLDSGQAVAAFTFGAQFAPRQATFLHVEAGAQENPAPGGEFDLGFGVGPRTFAPHSFTGTRSIWASAEHRIFLADQLLANMGLGVTTFLDYGGAWYPDQDPRFGGNVGVGLLIGFSRASGANIGQLDVAYRFGRGFEDKRFELFFGRGFLF